MRLKKKQQEILLHFPHKEIKIKHTQIQREKARKVSPRFDFSLQTGKAKKPEILTQSVSKESNQKLKSFKRNSKTKISQEKVEEAEGGSVLLCLDAEKIR